MRIIGRRVAPPPGNPPSKEARKALDTFSRRLTRAPKGVFRYASHEQMIRDRDRWTVDMMVETARARG
jgi:hypothetical protein